MTPKGTAQSVVVDLSALVKSKRDEILKIASTHGTHNVRLFGSVARGQAGPKSNIDFSIKLDSERSLMDHVALIQDLEDLLGRKVDVVSEGALHWYIRDRVLAEVKTL